MKKIGLKRGYRTPFVKMNSYFSGFKDAAEISCRLVDAMLDRLEFPQEYIQHVVWGMVVPDPQIYSIAREVVLGTRLDHRVEAYSISRACATSLQAMTNAASYYHTFPDEKSVSLVGGAESFSAIRPIVTAEASNYLKSLGAKGNFLQKLIRTLKIPISKLMPVPPSAREYSTGLTMGQHCELMVKQFKITRERQDRFALASHQNAAKARPIIQGQIIAINKARKDTLIREDSSMEALAKLKPAFDRKSGTVTAGNSSPLTDGAAGLYVISPALEPQVKPDAHLTDFEYVGVSPSDGLLIGPGKAMLRILQRHQLKWSDIDYVEFHEAFAGQVLCNVDALNDADYRKDHYQVDYNPGVLDEPKINPWGSSISYGHPFGATGARMVSQAIRYLQHESKNRALLAACTAGALAGACLIERSPD